MHPSAGCPSSWQQPWSPHSTTITFPYCPLFSHHSTFRAPSVPQISDFQGQCTSLRHGALRQGFLLLPALTEVWLHPGGQGSPTVLSWRLIALLHPHSLPSPRLFFFPPHSTFPPDISTQMSYVHSQGSALTRILTPKPAASIVPPSQRTTRRPFGCQTQYLGPILDPSLPPTCSQSRNPLALLSRYL